MLNQATAPHSRTVSPAHCLPSALSPPRAERRGRRAQARVLARAVTAKSSTHAHARRPPPPALSKHEQGDSAPAPMMMIDGLPNFNFALRPLKRFSWRLDLKDPRTNCLGLVLYAYANVIGFWFLYFYYSFPFYSSFYYLFLLPLSILPFPLLPLLLPIIFITYYIYINMK